MGTALTGLEIKDTYDGLVKTTDNGPLSGTAKYLSDGLGNDSALALSTTAVGIGTNSLFGKFNLADGANARLESTPVADGVAFEVLDSTRTNPLDFKIFANDILFNTKVSGSYTERMRIDSAGLVGIGTSTASRLLTLKNNTGATNGISFQSSVSTSEIAAIECNQTLDTIDFEMSSNYAGNGFRFLTGAPTLVERARFTANGLTFNGDTAAANALDDYEEGTFTPSITFGRASDGITYSARLATYVKIGRQVTVNGYILLTSKGTSTGTARISNLPFTISGGASFYCAANFAAIQSITYGGIIQGFGEIGATNIELNDLSEAGTQGEITNADFTNTSQIIFSLTYFV